MLTVVNLHNDGVVGADDDIHKVASRVGQGGFSQTHHCISFDHYCAKSKGTTVFPRRNFGGKYTINQPFSKERRFPGFGWRGEGGLGAWLRCGAGAALFQRSLLSTFAPFENKTPIDI